jgi:Fe-Mn family superoxide dismutase
MAHQLPPLPYASDALEPHVDARTMTLHHDMHHAAYVKALNTALSSAPEALRDKSAAWLMSNLSQIPTALRSELRHQAGGHLNHSLLWTNMSPTGGGRPEGALASAIDRDFTDFDAFKKAFEQAANKHFGAGWVWLVAGPAPQLALHIVTTNEHDNPLTDGYQPLLVNDLWEHAYYLKHENRRPEYLALWWSVVDWPAVAERLAKAVTAAEDLAQGEARIALEAVH